MSLALHSILTHPRSLTTAQRDAMFWLFSECYDCVTRPAFEEDLTRKTSIILLCDPTRTLRGFSTQECYQHSWHGETVNILFSGDTIVDPACWGSPELAKAWCQAAARTLAATPGRRCFWFLISKGYRTWLYLPVFFRHYLPSPNAGAPADWQPLLHDLANLRFGSAYDPATGLIRFPESKGQLTAGLATIPPARLTDPNVQFFLNRNPSFAEGTELACLTEITLENTHGPGRRWLARAITPAAVQSPPVPVPRNLRAIFANTLWRFACFPARRRLALALENPADAQRAVLHRILTANQHTAFARRHGLHPDMSPASFQAAVPISHYPAFQDDITRMMAGEPDILCAGKPLAFERSSGSTGAAKYIPFTKTLRAEFCEAVRAWMGDLLTRHPGAGKGPAWWIISPLRHPRELTPGGIPVGLGSDDEYLGPLERRLASWLWAAPPAIARLTSLPGNFDWTIRFLLQCPDLRLISVWNPSLLTLLWQRFLDHKDTFLTQLETGTGPTSDAFLTSFLRADPRRATALRRPPILTPQHLWPNLTLISGWADAEAAADAAKVRALFPHATFQPKGLLATEAVITIPWGDDTAAAVPALNSHFLEFLDPATGSIHLIHELRPGPTYEVILTNSGGLWRYRPGDLVRVEGHASATPRLRFTGRADDVCDLRGEKLHPGFVREALAPHLQGFRLLAPQRSADPPYYILFTPRTDISCTLLDQALAANPHYAHARQAGQLDPVRIYVIANPDPDTLYLQHCVASGQHAGTVKSATLHRASGWENVFTGHFQPPA